MSLPGLDVTDLEPLFQVSGCSVACFSVSEPQALSPKSLFQVFGCFMACCMVGSCCVKYLLQWRSPAYRYMREIYLLAAFSLMLPAFG